MKLSSLKENLQPSLPGSRPGHDKHKRNMRRVFLGALLVTVLAISAPFFYKKYAQYSRAQAEQVRIQAALDSAQNWIPLNGAKLFTRVMLKDSQIVQITPTLQFQLHHISYSDGADSTACIFFKIADGQKMQDLQSFPGVYLGDTRFEYLKSGQRYQIHAYRCGIPGKPWAQLGVAFETSAGYSQTLDSTARLVAQYLDADANPTLNFNYGVFIHHNYTIGKDEAKALLNPYLYGGSRNSPNMTAEQFDSLHYFIQYPNHQDPWTIPYNLFIQEQRMNDSQFSADYEANGRSSALRPTASSYALTLDSLAEEASGNRMYLLETNALNISSSLKNLASKQEEAYSQGEKIDYNVPIYEHAMQLQEKIMKRLAQDLRPYHLGLSKNPPHLDEKEFKRRRVELTNFISLISKLENDQKKLQDALSVLEQAE